MNPNASFAHMERLKNKLEMLNETIEAFYRDNNLYPGANPSIEIKLQISERMPESFHRVIPCIEALIIHTTEVRVS